jgi:hypothetical protein
MRSLAGLEYVGSARISRIRGRSVFKRSFACSSLGRASFAAVRGVLQLCWMQRVIEMNQPLLSSRDMTPRVKCSLRGAIIMLWCNPAIAGSVHKRPFVKDDSLTRRSGWCPIGKDRTLAEVRRCLNQCIYKYMCAQCVSLGLGGIRDGRSALVGLDDSTSSGTTTWARL